MKHYIDHKERFTIVYSRKETQKLLKRPVVLGNGVTVLDRLLAREAWSKYINKLSKHGAQTKRK